MFEIFMGASVPLAAGHESREKEAKTVHKLDVKGNKTNHKDLERELLLSYTNIALSSRLYSFYHLRLSAGSRPQG